MKAKAAKAFRQYDGGDKLFLAAATLADVAPTKRQFSRWKQGRGKAFAKKNEALAVAA